MAHSFRKFISEVFVNGKFPKILPSENFPLYGSYVCLQYVHICIYCTLLVMYVFSCLWINVATLCMLKYLYRNYMKSGIIWCPEYEKHYK